MGVLDRFLRVGETIDVARESTRVRQALEAELRRFVAIPFGSWNKEARGFENVWSQYSKQEFAEMSPRYPSPRIA